MHILAKTDPDLFATIDGQRVTTWSMARRARVASVELPLELREWAVALVPGEPNLLVVGSWREGVAAFDASTGSRLWHWRDLRQPQQVARVGTSRLVAVGFESGPAKLLSADTGKWRHAFPGVKKIFANTDGTALLLVSKKTIAYRPTEGASSSWSTKLGSNAVLDVAWGPTSLLVSEAGGSLRCFDPSGRLLWRADSTDEHALRVASDGAGWLAVMWNYRDGGVSRLRQLDEHGTALGERELGAEVHDCALDATHLITPFAVYSLSALDLVWRFAESPVASPAGAPPRPRRHKSLDTGQALVWWGPGCDRTIASPAELDAALDECATRGPILVRVILPNAHKLIIGLGAELSFLCITPGQRGPYATSVGDPNADSKITFRDAGEARELRLRYCVPASVARAAAREFFATGKPPASIEWEAVLLSISWMVDEREP